MNVLVNDQSLHPDAFSVAQRWWKSNIGDREIAHHKAVAARLSRASILDALLEAEVHEFHNAIRNYTTWKNYKGIPVNRIVGAACLIATVRENTSEKLARCIGGREPKVSKARFQRLIRTDDDDEMLRQMRQMVEMADHRCNVGSLASDIIFWGDETKRRWCIDYFTQ